MSAARCWALGCTDSWLYDGLCERHLWEAEHTSAYMGGPHASPHPECPDCTATLPITAIEEGRHVHS